MKVLIIANGKKPEKEFLKEHLKGSELVIAVDGAAKTLREYGLNADICIGDFDSVDPSDIKYQEDLGAEIISYESEKDDTDTLLAVDEAIKRGAGEITILGALGFRFDHSFANALLLARALENNVKAVIKDESNTIFAAKGRVELEGKKGGIVSILPLTKGTVADKSCGLKYPLKNLKLPLGRPLGVSNEMTGGKASFIIKSGIALVVLPND